MGALQGQTAFNIREWAGGRKKTSYVEGSLKRGEREPVNGAVQPIAKQ